MIRHFHLLGAIRRYASSSRSLWYSRHSPRGQSKANGPSSPNNHLQPLPVLTVTAQLTLILHLIQTYFIEVSACAGPSMLPTLAVQGDWVLINKRHRRGRGIATGDIVDFVRPTVPATGAVKRVVGMPGDFVASDYQDGIANVERELVVERDSSGNMILRGTGRADSVEKLAAGVKREHKMIQVPEGHCWILGDNLAESRDSRTYGPLPLALIKGKVLARVLPWAGRGWLVNNLERVR